MRGKLVVGIDIGGTATKGVLLRLPSPRPLASAVRTTPRSRRGLLRVITDLHRTLSRNRRIAGMGLSIAGIVDPARGIIVKAPNVPFLNNWRIAAAVAQRLGVKTLIENDARCFLLAEATYGAAAGKGSAAGVVVGTGIGGAFMVSGKLQQGAHGSAGEFGHMTLALKPKRASWEELGGYKAYRKQGDRSVVIGAGVANLINAFDPEMVVLGGGGVWGGAVKLGIVRREARHGVVSPLARGTPVLKGRMGPFASAIGAAMLFPSR